MSGLHLDIALLETERLILRAPRLDDYPAFRDFFGSPRAQMTGGPVASAEAWRRYAALLGHWLTLLWGMVLMALSLVAMRLAGGYPVRNT